MGNAFTCATRYPDGVETSVSLSAIARTHDGRYLAPSERRSASAMPVAALDSSLITRHLLKAIYELLAAVPELFEVLDRLGRTSCATVPDCRLTGRGAVANCGEQATQSGTAWHQRPARTTRKWKCRCPLPSATAAAYSIAARSELSNAPAMSRPLQATSQQRAPTCARVNSSQR